MPVTRVRIVSDIEKMADEARGIFDHMRQRPGGLKAACNRAMLRDWLAQSREHYAASWKPAAGPASCPVVVSLDDLRELAEMAAGAWQDIQDLPPEEQGDFADALLENSLDLHRKYFTDGWKAEKERLARIVPKPRPKTGALDGFRGLLRDAAFIINAAHARYPGLVETTHVERVIEDNLAQSRAHHFPSIRDRTR
jgi:hypothetical protein